MKTRYLWSNLQTAPLPYWAALVTQSDSERYAYTPWAYLTVVLFLVTAGGIFLFSGLVWGMFMAVRVAQVLARGDNQPTLDVLSITPLGPLGVTWQVLASVLHYDIDLGHFLGLRRLVISILTLPLSVLLPLIALVMLVDPRVVDLPTFFAMTIVLALLPVTYLDPIYGLLIGGLIASLSARHARSDAPVQAAALTLGVQLVLYVVPGLVAFVGLPLGYRFLRIWGWAVVATPPLVATGLYIGLHELLIARLWREVTEGYE
jgi:hypothetical protein